MIIHYPFIILKVARWALVRKEFKSFSLSDILFNWEACMSCGRKKNNKIMPWTPPPVGAFKFNEDGASRGKPGPASIGGVLHNSKGEILLNRI